MKTLLLAAVTVLIVLPGGVALWVFAEASWHHERGFLRAFLHYLTP